MKKAIQILTFKTFLFYRNHLISIEQKNMALV